MSEPASIDTTTKWQDLFSQRGQKTIPPQIEEELTPNPLLTLPAIGGPDAVDSGAVTPESTASGYQAFLFDRTQRGDSMYLTLSFRSPQSNVEEGYVMPMPHLLGVYFIGDDNVVLNFTQATFEITGRKVRDLVPLLSARNLQEIREFDPHRWQDPPSDQPKVAKISLIADVTRARPDSPGRAR